MSILILTIITSIIGSLFDIFATKTFFDNILGQLKETKSKIFFYVISIIGIIILYANMIILPESHALLKTLITNLLSLTDYFLLTFVYNIKTSRRIFSIILLQLITAFSEVISGFPFIKLYSANHVASEIFLIELIILFLSKILSSI